MNLLTRMWSPISRFFSIEPDGILNAWTTQVRAKVAKTTAISRASRYSRSSDFSACMGDRRLIRSADQAERPLPARLGEEADRRLAQVAELGPQALPLAVRGLAAVGPVDEEGAPLDQVGGQRPPEPRVVGVVAVVAHAEVVAGRHGERTVVVPHHEAWIAEGVGVLVHGVARIFDRLAVDVELRVDDLDRVAAHGDAALDEVERRVLRRAEDDDVAALDTAERQQAPLRPGGPGAVDEPVDEEVVADQEGVLHGAARDVEGLDDEGVGEQQEHRGDDQRLEVFAPDRPFFRHGAATVLERAPPGKRLRAAPNPLTRRRLRAGPCGAWLRAPSPAFPRQIV